MSKNHSIMRILFRVYYTISLLLYTSWPSVLAGSAALGALHYMSMHVSGIDGTPLVIVAFLLFAGLGYKLRVCWLAVSNSTVMDDVYARVEARAQCIRKTIHDHHIYVTARWNAIRRKEQG